MMYREDAKDAVRYEKPTEEEIEYIGRDTIYAYLARERERLFPNEMFEDLYASGGRPGVPPSVLMGALILQSVTRCSDAEVKEKVDFDARWRCALGLAPGYYGFAKSTYQEFRKRLMESGKAEELLARTLADARAKGYLVSRRIRLATDTTPVNGRGAVKDTYNLLADGIQLVVRCLAEAEGKEAAALAGELGLTPYFGSSVKGEAGIDWSDAEAREVFLTGIVADADRLLYEARRYLAREESSEEPRDLSALREACELLARLIDQDVERTPEGCRIKKGVAKDRVISVHDPEMRHGRKSSSHRFNGHKAAVAVETETGLITAVEVLPGNAPDSQNVMKLVEETEKNADAQVEQVIGDCAYGSGGTREAFEEAGIELVAPVPQPPANGKIPKQSFEIDLERGAVTCPQGHTTTRFRWVTVRVQGERVRVKEFQFASEVCRSCPLYEQCVKSRKGRGRVVRLHPQERLLQEARAFQETEAFREAKKRRQVVEHRIARLVQLGMRQARYFGRRKTLFQLILAAVAANITLTMGFERGNPPFCSATSDSAVIFCLFCVFILVFWLRLLPCFRVLARCRRRIISSLPATTI